MKSQRLRVGILTVSLRKLVQLGVLLALPIGCAVASAANKRKQTQCDKPPALVSKSQLSKEDQERVKARKVRMQGSVAIAIGAEGDVVDARVVQARSDEAGKLLIKLVKSMKFTARSGCGIFRTVVNFDLGN